jgi:methyl coenzyme M reductase system subunit A2
MDETFIIVSHDMDFVREVCDQVALMKGGKITVIGSPDEVLEDLGGQEKEKRRPEVREAVES